MNYAVIKSGGKQYKVSEGSVVELDRLSQKDGDITFEEVLLFAGEGSLKIGKPFLSGIKVTGKIVKEKKGQKIRVAKFKAKSRYRRVTGFRSSLSVVKIEKVEEFKKGSSKLKKSS